MRCSRVVQCCFSPSRTTGTVARLFSDALPGEKEAIDLLRHPLEKEKTIPEDTLLVVAVPVYSGRVPAVCAQQIARLKGKGAPAVALAVYGNRDYDDALLELTDILTENGFNVVGAGAFIARHSIFPRVAAGRPDDKDTKRIREFAAACLAKLESGVAGSPVNVKGNRPYREAGQVPLKPAVDARCNGCGACVRVCPTRALTRGKPPARDAAACISCAACIAVCPQHAQAFRGVMYALAGCMFSRKNKGRKEPEYFV